MQRVPSATESACLQLGLIAHRQHERRDRIPIWRREAALDPAHGSLRGSSTQCQRLLAETQTFAMPTDHRTKTHDIDKYIASKRTPSPRDTRDRRARDTAP